MWRKDVSLELLPWGALASDEGNHRKEDKEKGKDENEAAISGQLLDQTAPEADLPMNFF